MKMFPAPVFQCECQSVDCPYIVTLASKDRTAALQQAGHSRDCLCIQHPACKSGHSRHFETVLVADKFVVRCDPEDHKAAKGAA